MGVVLVIPSEGRVIPGQPQGYGPFRDLYHFRNRLAAIQNLHLWLWDFLFQWQLVQHVRESFGVHEAMLNRRVQQLF